MCFYYLLIIIYLQILEAVQNIYNSVCIKSTIILWIISKIRDHSYSPLFYHPGTYTLLLFWLETWFFSMFSERKLMSLQENNSEKKIENLLWSIISFPIENYPLHFRASSILYDGLSTNNRSVTSYMDIMIVSSKQPCGLL